MRLRLRLRLGVVADDTVNRWTAEACRAPILLLLRNRRVVVQVLRVGSVVVRGGVRALFSDESLVLVLKTTALFGERIASVANELVESRPCPTDELQSFKEAASEKEGQHSREGGRRNGTHLEISSTF